MLRKLCRAVVSNRRESNLAGKANSASQSQLKAPLDEYRSFNSMVETFFKTIKAELIWRNLWDRRR
jgi:hypothetical protein